MMRKMMRSKTMKRKMMEEEDDDEEDNEEEHDDDEEEDDEGEMTNKIKTHVKCKSTGFRWTSIFSFYIFQRIRFFHKIFTQKMSRYSFTLFCPVVCWPQRLKCSGIQVFSDNIFDMISFYDIW